MILLRPHLSFIYNIHSHASYNSSSRVDVLFGWLCIIRNSSFSVHLCVSNFQSNVANCPIQNCIQKYFTNIVYLLSITIFWFLNIYLSNDCNQLTHLTHHHLFQWWLCTFRKIFSFSDFWVFEVISEFQSRCL